jgi:type II secretory pathway pseudopilin PulG
MPKLLIFKHRKSLNQGFTTLEILVSIIIALAFVSVAMQTFVLAMGMKVQAQEKQRANQLIQEDMERTNNLGSNIPPQVKGVSPNPDHTFIQRCNAVPPGGGTTSDYANGFAKDLWDALITDVPDDDEKLKIQLLKMANGTPAGKTIGLSRTHVTASSTSPHRTLKINYQVQELDSSGAPTGDVIAQRYVEVIPDVALQCP